MELKVKSRFDNAQERKEELQRKLYKDSEDKVIKGINHKETLERKELEKAATLLENLEKKRKAVIRFETVKKQLQKDVRGRNTEKSNITQQQALNQ